MVVIRPLVIIDQKCDVNIFIMGIIYPKIMCPNCVHTKLSCSGFLGKFFLQITLRPLKMKKKIKMKIGMKIKIPKCKEL